METLIQRLKAATRKKRKLEWVLIKKWTLLMNASVRAKDQRFKDIFKMQANELVKASGVTIH